MKKSLWALLGITGVFFCILLGVFIGRNFVSNGIIINNNHNNSITESSDQTQNVNVLDLNAATLDELVLLPGIGETLAQRIIDYRTEHNGFTSVDELKRVSGIGDKKFEDIMPYVRVGGSYEDIGS